jgi:hypothetical protein
MNFYFPMGVLCQWPQRTYGAEVVEEYRAGDPIHEKVLQMNPDSLRAVDIYDPKGRWVQTKHKIVGVFHPLKRRGDTLSVRSRQN